MNKIKMASSLILWARSLEIILDEKKATNASFRDKRGIDRLKRYTTKVANTLGAVNTVSNNAIKSS